MVTADLSMRATSAWNRNKLATLFVFALLGAPVFAAPPKVEDVLDAHARAVGPVTSLKSLRARSHLRVGGEVFRNVMTTWRLPDECVREIPQDRGAWIESFGADGAYVSRGAFARYRPRLQTTAGGYYLFAALAQPVPMIGYLSDPSTQRRLKVGQATIKGARHNVLYSEADAQGVRAVYIFDPKTGLLANLRFEIEANKPIANVTYRDYRRVGDVMLPHETYAYVRRWREDAAQRAIVPLKPITREQRVVNWELNPNIDAQHFGPRGLGAGGGKDFVGQTLATGVSPYEVAIGDLDGDGKADVAVAHWGGATVHFGGAWKTPVSVKLGGGHHRGAAIVDSDGDGRFEFVTTSNIKPDNTYFRVRFDAKRVADVSRNYGAPLFTRGIAARDFDRDGVPDMVAAGWGRGEIRIRFGNGLGGARIIGSGWPLDTDKKGRRGFGVDVGDVNGDLLDDIAVVDGERLLIFEGAPNLSFHPRMAPIPCKRPTDVEFVDLDNDGRDDLLVVSMAPNADIPAELAVVANTGDSLKVIRNLEAGSSVRDVESGDFNGDGNADAVTSSYFTGEVSVFMGDGARGFAKSVRYRCDRGANRIAVGDIDGDGSDDIVVTNNLADTVTILRNQTGKRALYRRPSQSMARAVSAAPAPTFRLKGLSETYEFAGEFHVPADILDPSGIAVLGGDGVHTQFAFVSDKSNAIFRGILDKAGRRLLIGPAIPLRGPGLERRLDLEAMDFYGGNFFLGVESDSTVIRTDIFGRILARVKTNIPVQDNDGIEALAMRVRKDGALVLYVLKERWGKTLRRPEMHAFDVKEDPFELTPRGKPAPLPAAAPDWTGATFFGQRLFAVSRFGRFIAEFSFVDDGVQDAPKSANFRALTDGELGLLYEPQPLFGLVEGMAFDPQGDLLLVVDHNGREIGKKGRNRANAGRILWFRNVSKTGTRKRLDRVELRQILVPVAGARIAPEVKLTPAQALVIARAIAQRARRGEDIDSLAAESAYTKDPLPIRLDIVRHVTKAPPGVFRLQDLPRALGRMAFRLDVGEVSICEFHPKESPDGYRVVVRVQ